jgi:ribosomal protein S18 acetylase RimI-like enzyme
MASRLPVQLQAYTHRSPLLDEAVRVFTAVWPGRAPAVTRNAFARYANYPDFRGFAAIDDGVMVGFGFGVRSRLGGGWHDQVAARLGADHPALREAWRLVELAVMEEHRGRGIGGDLHDAVLGAQPCPRTLLSTYVTNYLARAMYMRRGWYVIDPAFHFRQNTLPYVILAKELGACARAEHDEHSP